MRKLKVLFFSAIFFLAAFILLFFTQNQSKFSSKKVNIKSFNIVEISGEGVFYKSRIIDVDNVQKISISDQEKLNKLSLYVDNNTSYKFRFFNSFFTVLPDSFINYDHSKLSLMGGEFYWNIVDVKNTKNKPVNNTISLPNNNKLFLSKKGRVVITGSEIKIWNYKGALTLWSAEKEYKIKSGTYIALTDKKDPIPIVYLAKPDIFRPEDNLKISSQKESIVQFQWKDLLSFKKNNDTIFLIRFYSSRNMGKLSEDQERNADGLFSAERRTTSSNIPIDLSALNHTNTVYWRIFPFDKTNNIEGEPSEIRKLEIANFLLNNKEAQMPPKLDIDPPSISGNIVILSGEADPKSRLFINGKEYEINQDGKFNLNISYEKNGIYTIVFELSSPSDRKNIQKRIVRIFE